MRKFRFRFATVEKVRRSREDEALRALGEAQQKLRLEIEQRQQLERDRNAALLRRENLGVREPMNALVFQLETEFIDGQKQRLGWADQAIFRARKGVERAMRAYLLARRASRVIELIREKDLLAFRRHETKREARLLDDLYVMRAGLAAIRRNEEEIEMLGGGVA
jgi:flagellar export protein FliJ